MFWQSAVRVRPGVKTDRGGNHVADWDNATRTPVDRLTIQPTSQTETTDTTRTAVVSGWFVMSEPSTNPDVLASDRIEFDAITCEVIGEVARWPDSLGGVHHVEWTMRRATG